jgi:hypothetical protein
MLRAFRNFAKSISLDIYVCHGNCVLHCQSMNEVTLKNFKGISQDRGQAKFSKNLHTSNFSKDIYMYS